MARSGKRVKSPKVQAVHFAGYRARFRGYSWGECPYDGPLADAWLDGWEFADERIRHGAQLVQSLNGHRSIRRHVSRSVV